MPSSPGSEEDGGAQAPSLPSHPHGYELQRQLAINQLMGLRDLTLIPFCFVLSDVFANGVAGRCSSREEFVEALRTSLELFSENAEQTWQAREAAEAQRAMVERIVRAQATGMDQLPN